MSAIVDGGRTGCCHQGCWGAVAASIVLTCPAWCMVMVVSAVAVKRDSKVSDYPAGLPPNKLW